MKADKSDKDATNREKANLDKQQDKTKEKQQLREEEKPPDIDRRVDEKVKEPMKDKGNAEHHKQIFPITFQILTVSPRLSIFALSRMLPAKWQ